MMRCDEPGLRREQQPDAGRWFATTIWTVVLDAARRGTPEGSRALESLCASYWRPLYTWLRCRGGHHYNHHDAEDLLQSFFEFILRRNALSAVHPTKGRFRSFLLASLKHFVANERDRAEALKRGGQCHIASLDADATEPLISDVASSVLAPDEAFERSWAMTLFGAVLARLRAEYEGEGRAVLYGAIQPYLTDDKRRAPYAETSRALGMGEGAVRMAVLRLRRRFGELLRAEIALTVESPDEIDDEIRALLAAVAG